MEGLFLLQCSKKNDPTLSKPLRKRSANPYRINPIVNDI